MTLRSNRGSILIEATVALVIAGIAFMAAAAVLQNHSRHVRLLYDERVAWETASAQLEILEARGWKDLKDGRSEVAIDAPGWKNLREAKCSVLVERTSGGMRRVTVDVEWTSFDGGRRSVRARTLIGDRP